VKPGEQVRRRPVSTQAPADEPPPNEGDLICGECGAGNVPTRKFCRRCGASLLTAQVRAKPPWWRRLLNRLRGRRYEAGYRRQVRQPVRIQGRLILIFALAALILLAAFPGRPYIHTGIELVKDRTRAHVPVTPVAARASSFAPKAEPGRVYDGVSNQYWAPAPLGVAEGQWFEVDLPEPTRVLDLVLHTGVALDRKTFLTQGRPREVSVTFTSDKGETTSHVIRLRDEPGKQQFEFRADRVTKVRITLRSAYGARPNRRVAVAELEVFGRG
jgi:ribosomal protein L40E